MAYTIPRPKLTFAERIYLPYIGLQQLANRRLTRSGLFNTIYVMPRDVDRGPRRDQPNTPPRPLDDSAVADIQKVAHVAEVNPEMRFMAEVRSGDKSRFIMVAALPPSARDREAFDGMAGKFFSSPEADEVILDSDFAKELAPENTDAKVHIIAVAQLPRRTLRHLVAGPALHQSLPGAH